MSDQAARPYPTNHPPAVERRHLLRSGAILAGVAGLATASAVSATPADAADGDPAQLGAANTADSVTGITIGAGDGSAEPALSLANAGGPTLELAPLDESWDQPLGVGQIANRTTGPLIGIDHGNGAVNTYLALGTDLAALPIPYAFTPYRLLDTRTAAGRDNVLATSSGAYDAKNRLKRGHWLDVAVFPADDEISVQGAYANVAVTDAAAGGHLIVHPPAGERPVASAINFAKGQTIANGGFFEVSVSEDWQALRIWASQTTHVILDVTGLTLMQQPGPTAARARNRTGASRTGARRTDLRPAAIRARLGRS